MTTSFDHVKDDMNTDEEERHNPVQLQRLCFHTLADSLYLKSRLSPEAISLLPKNLGDAIDRYFSHHMRPQISTWRLRNAELLDEMTQLAEFIIINCPLSPTECTCSLPKMIDTVLGFRNFQWNGECDLNLTRTAEKAQQEIQSICPHTRNLVIQGLK